MVGRNRLPLAAERKIDPVDVRLFEFIHGCPGAARAQQLDDNPASLGRDVRAGSLDVDPRDLADFAEVALQEVRPVLVHNLQVNPKSDEPVHVDFLQVDLKAKVSAEVPVELVGESPAEKQGIGTVVQQINEIEVEALPTDLPEKFEVNVEGLSEVDQAIYVKDLKVDRTKVELKSDPEAIVAKV